MMRILFMVFHFPPISGGGVVVIVELLNKLAELGHSVTVLTPELDWSGEKYDPHINQTISVVKVPTPAKNNLKIAARRCYPSMKKKGIELAKKEKFDFVFSIFHPFHLVPKAAVECGKATGLPTLVKIDDAVYEKAAGLKSIQRKIEKIVNSKTLRQATRVLVSNVSTKDLVSGYYKVPKEKIGIIPNGVKLDYFTQSKHDTKKVVFSGAMYYHRGLDILLEAAPEIVRQVPDVRFVFLGSGPENDKLKEIVAQKNLQNHVSFEGWVEREKIPSYLAEGTIGIGPLRSTTVTKNALPIKVLEYMAASLPVIAMENTLPDDVLVDGKNGFIVKDASELAQKISSLLQNDEERAKMGKNSLEMVKKFDWANVANQIVDEYKKCV